MIKQKLEFCANNNINVLLIGEAGVGKTALILETFKKLDLNWKYFSASTMDPWVDFIGIPKEQTDSNGNSYLELVRMKGMDEVEALFFDEYNRSHKKIRNAVMELIQFKSINGHKFPNLKIVWAAINPDDEEETYDVEKLDPAQKDRFPVQIEIPYLPDKKYFNKMYSNNGIVICEWWEKLPKEKQKQISPRRLDYALEYYNLMGDIRDILPKDVNISELIKNMNNNILDVDIESIYLNKDKDKARKLMKNFNIQKNIIESVKGEKKIEFFLNFVEEEFLMTLVNEDKYFNIILKNSLNNKYFSYIIEMFHNNTKDEMKKNKIFLYAKVNPEWGEKILKIIIPQNKMINSMIPKEINNNNFNNLIKLLKDKKSTKKNFGIENIYKSVGYNINKEQLLELYQELNNYILFSRKNTLIKYKKELQIFDFLMEKSLILWKSKKTLDLFISLQSIRILKELDIYNNFI